MPDKKITVVIPVYNEAANIPLLHRELSATLTPQPYQFEFIFVDDGSRDNSLDVIRQLAREDNRVFYVELSRNFGQQYALKAGMDISRGDCVISMDCDLQHPPEVVVRLIEKWEEGFDVVYTTRHYDRKLPLIKRKTSTMFYSVLNSLSDIDLDQGTADFRLMDRRVVNALTRMNESSLFLRGLVKWSGFKQVGIEYQARDRQHGESKYGFSKMFNFGIQGILSFSTKPLVLIMYAGISTLILSVLVAVGLLTYYLSGNDVSSTVVILTGVMFFVSLQIAIIGIVCLYLAKLVTETRHRPLYFIRDTNYQ